MIRKLFFIAIIWFIPVSGQSKYKFSFESGYLHSEIRKNMTKSDLLSRLELKYFYKYKKMNLKLKAQPGFIGIKLKPKDLKLKGEFLFQARSEKFNYGFNATYQLNNYYENEIYRLGVISLSGLVSVIASKRSDISFNTSYHIQRSKFTDSQDIERISVSCALNYFTNRNLQFNYGLYYERFFIDSESNFILEARNQSGSFRDKNDGYRIGPMFSVSYTKNFIVRLKYKYLYQKTKIFEEASIEHSVRLLAGKLLDKDWSLFVLVDYTQPVYNFELKSYRDKNLLYISSNYENNYYLKLARKIGKRFSIYTKAGYFNESIKYFDYDFKGWNCLLGIELQ